MALRGSTATGSSRVKDWKRYLYQQVANVGRISSSVSWMYAHGSLLSSIVNIDECFHLLFTSSRHCFFTTCSGFLTDTTLLQASDTAQLSAIPAS